MGSFEPRKFPQKNVKNMKESIFILSIKDKTIFKDKTVSIFGGGDSALDWAIEFQKSQS